MKYAWLGCLLCGSVLFGGTQDSDLNVNTRYTVDAVSLVGKGWQTSLAARSDQSENAPKLSARLRHDLMALINEKLNPSILDTLAVRIRRELNARQVEHRLLRSDVPEHVRVEFDVKPARASLDLNVSEFMYNSREGWNGAGEVGFDTHNNYFLFGLVSDGDTLNERYAGISGRYENRFPGTDRVKFGFKVESYHDQWNMATEQAAVANQRITGDVYRSRMNVEPSAVIRVSKPITVEVGASFERFDDERAGVPSQSANALMGTIRYHRALESSELQQEFNASYGLRTAARPLGSDFAYTRQLWDARYNASRGKSSITEIAWGGSISGRAPLDDRFVLGNSTALRGWNKYEVDPIGGNRVVANTVEYRYGHFQAFYDAGAIWDEGQPATFRHSVGVGLKESILSLAVAFPVRGGHVEPVLIMGILY
ncbi:MAG TPA: BamA/TamA family outer membrane protein [Candidatus Limnocylindrales bacterium]|nr:BamA/TamA family outer membrane protein [Candidatus Limnocylindrales bacterium]